MRRQLFGCSGLLSPRPGLAPETLQNVPRSARKPRKPSWPGSHQGFWTCAMLAASN